MTTTEETLPELPVAPLCLHPHNAANEPVALHHGPVAVHHGGGTAQGTADLSLQWQPRTGLRLNMELEPDHALEVAGEVTVDVAGGSTKTFLSSVQHRWGQDGSAQTAEAGIRFIETGTPDNLASMGFQLVNFPDFFSRQAHAAPEFGLPLTSLRMTCPGWIIEMAAVENSTDIHKSLKATGGYAFTHTGRIRREDGSVFSAVDAEPVVGALHSFFGFARGAACGIPVQWGLASDGTVCWQRWGSSVMNAWADGQPWFDEHHGDHLAQIFPAFFKMHNDDDQRPPLKMALHWYMKSCSREGGMEGAIILGLTALDLLGAFIIVDKNSLMTSDDYDDLKAWKKLAKLMETLKVSPDIPAKYADLRAFSRTNNWQGLAKTLTDIRHGFVHPKPANRKAVFAAPGHSIFQAWQLSLWLQELALLYLLDHRGKYRNRVDAEWVGQVVEVAWA